jgi:hypothetical protein
MALAELCGMSDFDTFNREDNIHNEIVKMSNNFTLNTHLSVPPFANVSYPQVPLSNLIETIVAGRKPGPLFQRRVRPRHKNQI